MAASWQANYDAGESVVNGKGIPARRARKTGRTPGRFWVEVEVTGSGGQRVPAEEAVEFLRVGPCLFDRSEGGQARQIVLHEPR